MSTFTPAGVSWTWWIWFHVAVIALLGVEALLSHREGKKGSGLRAAWIWTAVLAALAVLFAGWIAISQGRQPAMEFAAGYVVEISLSIDNLFVFLVLFEGFSVSLARQHQALRWGVGGAMLMRYIFIAAGVLLLHRFEWMTWIFGSFLLYVSWRLLRGSSARDAVPIWTRRFRFATGTLLPIIIAVEITDLLFAVDSIPAVLAISRNLFVVYTSNIAAILGLRSLYFVLNGLLDRFRHLHYGIAALLGLIALKMLLAKWITVSIALSLAVMISTLTICIIASWASTNRSRP